jgi:DsbC/DsbD-like thiol-disulfide interchange protein
LYMNKLYMKKMTIGICLMLFAVRANAQINNPVMWLYSAKKIADKTYELHMTATINANWHLYGQGPGATGLEPTTTITFINNPLINFEGSIREVGKPEQYYDKNFKSVLKYYTNTVDFVQTVKLRSSISTVIKGTVKYVVCNDRSCLPPKDVPFTINIGGK